jgi:hypothetical protein
MIKPIANVAHFVYRTKDFGEYWVVAEYMTGAQAGRGWSVARAVNRAEFNINHIGEEQYKEKLQEFLLKYGNSNLLPLPEIDDRPYEQIEKELSDLYAAETSQETESIHDTITRN